MLVMVQATGTSTQSASATPVYFGMDPSVKTYWECLPDEQRTEVLSLPVKHMRERANTHHMVSGACSPLMLPVLHLVSSGQTHTAVHATYATHVLYICTAHQGRSLT